MLAWQKFGNRQTPASTGLKGDKLVGNFYVEFDKAYKVEIAALMAQGKNGRRSQKTSTTYFRSTTNAFRLGKWETRSYWTLENHEPMGIWWICGYI